MNLICIDPGDTTGYAVFLQRQLVVAGFTKREDLFKVSPRADMPGSSFSYVRHVIVEQPQFRKHARVSPNDLITLAVLVGEVKRHYEQQGCTVELVTPIVWKGAVDKARHNAWVLEKLTATEFAVMQRRPRAKTPDNNMVDAIGLGLWKLGRFRVR